MSIEPLGRGAAMSGVARPLGVPPQNRAQPNGREREMSHREHGEQSGQREHHGNHSGQREPEAVLSAEGVEFVRFCHRRNWAEWPDLYDEMCAVAARGSFRGLGYEELDLLGVSFALTEVARLAAAAALVIEEERRSRRSFAGGWHSGSPATA